MHADKQFIYSSAGKNFTILLMSIGANFWRFGNDRSFGESVFLIMLWKETRKCKANYEKPESDF